MKHMPDDEIVVMYRQAKNKKAQIKILAQLNDCHAAEIEALLIEKGEFQPMKKWTQVEDDQIMEWKRNGMKNLAIAERIGVSEATIRSRFYVLKKKGLMTPRIPKKQKSERRPAATINKEFDELFQEPAVSAVQIPETQKGDDPGPLGERGEPGVFDGYQEASTEVVNEIIEKIREDSEIISEILESVSTAYGCIGRTNYLPQERKEAIRKDLSEAMDYLVCILNYVETVVDRSL